MGYYIETGTSHNKAAHIIENHNGVSITESQAKELMVSGEKDVIVVVHNMMFEAAAFAFDMGEFEAFTSPDDGRPRRFISLEKGLGAKLSGYN